MNHKSLFECSIVLICFSAVCFIGAFVLNNNKNTEGIAEYIKHTGGMVGPFHVDKPKSVFEVKVQQDISKNSQWSTVTAELLDADQEVLFGFGKDFYRESGYDADGAWSENVNNYKMKITIAEPGDYYVDFDVEHSPGLNTDIYITIDQKMGSVLPLFAAGLISLVLGVGIYYWINQSDD